MNKFLEKLLNGAKVEWKRLGEVAKYEQPTKYIVKSTSYNENYNIPVLTAGKTFLLGYTNETEGICKASENPVIIFDDFTTANKWVDFDFKVKSSAMKIITAIDENICLLKYIYYWLNTLPNELIEVDHKRQWINKYSNKKIPIPPLHVQREIVRILDKFTELTKKLTTELTTELTNRKKQYEYYCDKLLTLIEKNEKWYLDDVEIEWKKLGEVANVQRGASPRPISKYITNNENGIPWIKIGDTLSNSKYITKTAQKITPEGAKKSRVLKKGDFILSNSMSFGRPYILNIDGAIHDGWASINNFEFKLNPDYLYYYLSSKKVQNYWKSKINSSSVSNLNVNIIKSLKIPIPPLSKQREIVEILDKFDILTNSISEGLPKEIELRKKQYEYYRDMLLDFPKPDEEGE